MSDYETLVDDLIGRYPHLVLEMTGPWRERDGQISELQWICNFKNRSRMLQYVHPGTNGTTMAQALTAGLEFLDLHADDAAVRNHDDPPGSQPSPSA